MPDSNDPALCYPQMIHAPSGSLLEAAASLKDF